MVEYSKEQFWKLYKTLPQELRDSLFSEETGDDIYEILERNKALTALEKVVELVGQVLLGLLPPDDFATEVKDQTKLKKATAEKVAREITRFVIYPAKPALERLHQKGVEPAATNVAPQLVSSVALEESEPTPPRADDPYREAIE
jgi:hypothetical protein